MSTLKYVVAGDRYNYYKLASTHQSYQDLSEADLVNNLCPTREVKYVNGRGQATTSGFGQVLSDFTFVSGDVPGGNKYWQHNPTKTSPLQEKFRQTITHSDHSTFVFLVGCWEGGNQRTWEVIANTPTLTEEQQKDIIIHARGMGFAQKNYIFLRYDSCQKKNPFLSSKSADLSLPNNRRATPTGHLSLGGVATTSAPKPGTWPRVSRPSLQHSTTPTFSTTFLTTPRPIQKPSVHDEVDWSRRQQSRVRYGAGRIPRFP